MVFPLVMYECESWTIKKAEQRGIDAFELWCWRKLLRVPWTTRRSKQSILKEISPEYSLEGLMVKWNSQYFGHLMRKTDSLENTLMLERLRAGGEEDDRGEGDDRGWDGWMTSPTQWTAVWVNSRSWWWAGRPGVLWFMGSQRVGHDWVTELNGWSLRRYRGLVALAQPGQLRRVIWAPEFRGGLACTAAQFLPLPTPASSGIDPKTTLNNVPTGQSLSHSLLLGNPICDTN